MLTWLKRLAYLVVTTILAIAYKLAENAALGWGDNMIGDFLGISSPTLPQITRFAWLWGMPFTLAAMTLFGYHKFTRWSESRHDALTVIPSVLPRDGNQVYLTPNEVVHYMAEESEWGAAIVSEDRLLKAPLEFQRRAAEGKVRVYGMAASAHELIDKTYWMSYGFHLEKLFKPPYDECHTWPTVAAWPLKTKIYGYLKIEAEDVYRTWPRNRNHHSEFETAFSSGFNRALFEDNKGDKEASRLRLAQLSTEGVVIRNLAGEIWSNTSFQKWVQRCSEWDSDVIQCLKQLSAVDAEWFATPGAAPASRVQIPNARISGSETIKMYEIAFRNHDYRLARLEKLLPKHGVGA